MGATEFLLNDVRESVGDLVQFIHMYRGMNRVAKITMSSLYKRRQEEAEAVINTAITRLQVRQGSKFTA